MPLRDLPPSHFSLIIVARDMTLARAMGLTALLVPSRGVALNAGLGPQGVEADAHDGLDGADGGEASRPASRLPGT